MRWFKTQRIEWIAETLRVFGFINREHLVKKFGISTAQASLDMATFRAAHPHALRYDTSGKRYEVTPAGKAALETSGHDPN